MIRNGKMEVELTVNTSEIEFIKVGNSVSFTDGATNFKGEIIRKGSFVNENTQNISVFAEKIFKYRVSTRFLHVMLHVDRVAWTHTKSNRPGPQSGKVSRLKVSRPTKVHG